MIIQNAYFYRAITEDDKKKFNGIWKTVYPEHKQLFMTRYRYFSHFVEIGMAVVSKTLNRDSNITKLLKLFWYAPIFLLSKSRRQSQFKTLIASGDKELLMKIIQFSGGSMSKFVFYMINPTIKFHKKIYIPKNYQKLTIKSLMISLSEVEI